MNFFSGTKNILELFTFDLTTFFVQDDFEIVGFVEEGDLFMVEYKKNLPWLEFDLFDHIILRVLHDKKNFLSNSRVNLRLSANKKTVTVENVKYLTNQLAEIYSTDDKKKEEWNEQDANNLQHLTFERTWTFEENKYVYTIKLNQTPTGNLELHIFFFNHFLKIIKQTVSFSL